MGRKGCKMTKDIEDICEEEKIIMITGLIGLGETQRKIYDKLKNQSEFFQGKLNKAYVLHQEELDLLIKYQHEISAGSK